MVLHRRDRGFRPPWNIFSTKGAEKRKQYGSKGATVFAIHDADRIWVVLTGMRRLASFT
jgi:hypothetical protein